MIQLAKFEQGDFAELMEWLNNETLLTNWAGSLFSFPLTRESLDWYIRNTNEYNASDAYVYKVVDEAGLMAGHISLGSISWKHQSARITRVLTGPAHRGKGLCGKMIQKALKKGFDELGMHRISLGVYQTNTAAIRCYEKSGFVKEGLLRDVLLHNDEWWSLLEMSILRSEWEAMQKKEAVL